MLQPLLMSARARKIIHARLESPTHGVVELAHDWRGRAVPPLVLLGRGAPQRVEVRREPEELFALASGYGIDATGDLTFAVRLGDYPGLREELVAGRLYVAGDFNGWDPIGRPEWELQPGFLAGEAVMRRSWRADGFLSHPWMRFKFVTESGRWLDVPADAPNAATDEAGNRNRTVDPDRTGWHRFRFDLPAPLDLAAMWKIGWGEDAGEAGSVPLMPGDFFFALRCEAPLGAEVRGGATVFRLFAPRARRVDVVVSSALGSNAEPRQYALQARGDGAWELALDEDLHGWYYWFHLDGPHDAFGLYDHSRAVLDPYARAAVGREGPGIILRDDWIGAVRDGFRTPAWHDLVIAEAHVRDLVHRAPISLGPRERRGFAGLAAWVRSRDFYLHSLGVNCVELQPVQEFDARTGDEYHWGYMTTNFFSPASAYATEPEQASGVHEFQDLVAAFHSRGIAVILDVVFNHVGEPAHLMFVDKLYYFDQDAAGNLTNWSGCGNDLRATAAMSRRLIIDSCTHFLRSYGVDGFRFDLAELLGADVLLEVEAALKKVKPDVILIAEPWSYRGHVARELRETGWASWNDGYRDFARDYLRGGSSAASCEYFLKGSPWHFAKWPAQTVNYTESHDDRTWIDVITENHQYDGSAPTANDRRRTHLMVAMLMMSVGIPMLASGQDFLRSKHGVSNTYQRGELNALDYHRLLRYPGSHTYVAAWVAFRRGPLGHLLRHYTRVSEGFFRFFSLPESTAVAALYNADGSAGGSRLLFAMNPTLEDVHLSIPNAAVAGWDWRVVADVEQFFGERSAGMRPVVSDVLFLPPLSCVLWVTEA